MGVGGPLNLPQRILDFGFEGAKWRSRERPVTQIALQVEAIELDRHARVDGFRENPEVQGQGQGVSVDQRELELRAEGEFALAETRPLQQSFECVEALC